MNTTTSILSKSNVKEYGPVELEEDGKRITIRAHVQYDDRCNNGHNTFSITGEYRDKYNNVTGGCIHNEISFSFPELSRFIKWHLTSSDGPMHYVANSIYWAKEGNLVYARNAAVWSDAELSDFTEEKLLARLPDLLNDFKKDIESLGFIF